MLTAGQKAAEAIKETRRARELDPFSLVINRNLGQVLFRAGRYDEALKILVPRVEVRIDPAFDVARLRYQFFLT